MGAINPIQYRSMCTLINTLMKLKIITITEALPLLAMRVTQAFPNHPF